MGSMEIKLDNGTVFVIEKDYNSISIQKLRDNKETTQIYTRQGCRFIIDDNLIYIG